MEMEISNYMMQHFIIAKFVPGKTVTCDTRPGQSLYEQVVNTRPLWSWLWLNPDTMRSMYNIDTGEVITASSRN